MVLTPAFRGLQKEKRLESYARMLHVLLTGKTHETFAD